MEGQQQQQQQPMGQQQQVVIVNTGNQQKEFEPAPQNVKPFVNGLFGCFEDCGGCKYFYPWNYNLKSEREQPNILNKITTQFQNATLKF